MKKVITVSLLLTLFSLNLLSINAQGANSKEISMEEAKKIALERVNGEIISAHLEKDDGMAYYEMIIQGKDGRYEVEIDKSSGKVLEVEKKRSW